MRHAKAVCYHPLSLQELEPRIAPAGNIFVAVVGGNLIITGDGASNAFTVDQIDLGNGQFHVTGEDSTRINGGDGRVTFYDVTGGFIINGGDGDDTAALPVSVIQGNVSFDGGTGDDSLTVGPSSIVEGSITMKGGAGSDSLRVGGVVRGNLSFIDGGTDDSTVTLDHCGISGNVSLKTGSQTTYLTINHVSVRSFSASLAGGDLEGTITSLATSPGMAGSVKLSGVAGASLAIGDLLAHGSFTLSGVSSGSTLSAAFQNSEVDGAFTFNSGHNGAVVSLDNCQVQGATKVSAGEASTFSATDSDFGVYAAGVKYSNVAITCSGGNLHVSLSGDAIGGSLTVNAKSSEGNVIDLSSVDIGKGLTAKFVSPIAVLHASGVTVGANTLISSSGAKLPADMTRVEVNDSVFGGAFTIRTGAGGDEIDLDTGNAFDGPISTFNGPVNISLGAGDDNLLLGYGDNPGNACVFHAPVILTGGSGDNVLYQSTTSTFATPPRTSGFLT